MHTDASLVASLCEPDHRACPHPLKQCMRQTKTFYASQKLCKRE